MDVVRTNAADTELVGIIERRTRKGEVDPDEIEPSYMESVRRYEDRRREEMRLAWCEHHQGQAARLRAVLEELIAGHEKQAESYREQPGGAP